MFSVVIPLYNKQESIYNTIKSVLNQTYTNFEIVLVNDGSTDNSLEVVEKIIDPRIRIIDKPNGGVSSARNKGIEEAKYEWIAFLDGDDLWKKNHLETIYNMILSYPDDKVFCTSFIRSNQNFPSTLDSTVVIIEDYFKEAIKDHFFWTSVVCINRNELIKKGKFDINLILGEDIDLWAKLARDNRFIKSNLITAVYRIDAENRACVITYNYKKSFISTISKKEKSESEIKYLNKLLLRRLYASILSKNFKVSIDIIKKLISC